MNNYNILVENDKQSFDEIIDFLARVFAPNYYDAKRIQEATIKSEPSTKPQNFILARTKRNELIGIVRIVERKMRIGSAILECGGVSSVSVHPDWRGQGIGYEMMNFAHETMMSRSNDLSFLHGRRALDGYYTKSGYCGINRYLDLEIISDIYGEEKLHVPPFQQQNIGIIRTLYDDTYKNLSGSIVRDEGIWNFLTAKMKEAGEQIKLFECYDGTSSDMIGYLIISGDSLVELSLPLDYFPYLLTLIKRLGLKYISIHPYHPFYTYVRSNVNTIRHERFSLNGGYMGRILNHFTLFSKISHDLWLRSSRIVGADNILRILGYEIELSTGKISKSSLQDDITFDNECSCIRFILGLHCSGHYSGVYLNPEKPWLKYLFPSTGFHTSAIDEI